MNPAIERAIAQSRESRPSQVKAYRENQSLWEQTVWDARAVFARLMDSPVRDLTFPAKVGDTPAVVRMSADDQTLVVDVRQPPQADRVPPESPWADIPDEGIIPDAPGACIVLAHIPGLSVNRPPDLPKIVVRLTAPDPDRKAVSYGVRRDDPRFGGSEPGIPRLIRLLHGVICGP